MEKQKITVRVAGKNYTLVSSDPPEYVRRVAALVDRRLKEMEIATGLPENQVMALTCFNLADELLKAKDEITDLKRRMQADGQRKPEERPGGGSPGSRAAGAKLERGNSMEILSPAGNREALERAQAAGADAVYLGYAAFSARAGAGNFDDEALAEALSFAHLHRMRVYVTVNTLVKDGELPGVLALLEKLAALRADGVLVQDLGILRLARERFPSLRLHASTQMAIHNATGVRWCAGMGMKRAVLARECSLEEIRKCAETGMEIEVFAHGAQCVAVSGECLFSSMVGERSGNRGRCAQPCRRQYRYDGREGAWLSPRDLCLRDRLPELRESGAASLKIEGRLKRPEYVYVTAASYRRGLDSLERGRFRPADAREQEALLQIFNRGGFMTGYAFGAEDAGVIFPESVNHQGVPLGEVESVREDLARVRLTRDLHDGDGLRIRRGRTEGEMTYAGKEVPAGRDRGDPAAPGAGGQAGGPGFPPDGRPAAEGGHGGGRADRARGHAAGSLAGSPSAADPQRRGNGGGGDRRDGGGRPFPGHLGGGNGPPAGQNRRNGLCRPADRRWRRKGLCAGFRPEPAAPGGAGEAGGGPEGAFVRELAGAERKPQGRRRPGFPAEQI